MPAYLERLRVNSGDKELYDAVSECSRCGYCEQSCPTYVASGKETYNPRGRNQLFRMILEGKLKSAAKAEEAFSTCLLCGACSSVCYANVKTAEFVLEGRRRIRKGRAPRLATLLTGLLADHPALLAWGLRLANLGRRLGLARLAGLLRLPRLLGLESLEAAERQVEAAPLKFLFERLAGDPSLAGQAWTYFSACGTNYLHPEVGLATLRCCREASGEGRYLGNLCCGLAAYNYGELESARAFARRVIERFERQGAGFLVADCSSCAAHLKSYEQLFMDEPEWRPRAKAFAAQVRDVLEVLGAAAERVQAALPKDFRVTYHDSCRARNAEGLVREPRELLKGLLAEHYVELPEADVCCGGAGAFAFAHPELSDAILRRKISSIAEVQADLVLTSSTSCLIQLRHGLKRYYPGARVQHISQFVAERFIGAEGAPRRKKNRQHEPA